ncbi:MAG: hypothetical protein ACREUV_02845 [Burkholderiales bacterium]
MLYFDTIFITPLILSCSGRIEAFVRKQPAGKDKTGTRASG